MDSYLGEIRLFAGSYAPPGWAICNGTKLAVNDYQALFTLLGITYGGDGQNTFGLPDLRSRIPVGQGQGPGLTNRPLATSFGSETTTLQVAQIPAHTHALQVATNSASAPVTPPQSPAGLLPATPSLASAHLYEAAPSSGTGIALASQTMGLCAGGGPHENRMATTALNFIICVQGFYPDFQ